MKLTKSSMEVTLETMARQIAMDNDSALIRMARQNDAALRKMAVDLGRERQKVLVLTAQLADRETRVRELESEVDSMRAELDFARIETRGAA